MEEETKKEMLDKEQPKTKKDAFLARFGERFPDVEQGDEEGFYGKLSEEFDKFDESRKAQQELGELLGRDPRSANFLMVMRKGGNPMEFLIEQYGDEFREALADEEKAKEFATAFSKYAERQAKNRELQAKAESNMQAMLDALDGAQAEGGFSDEEAAHAYEYLYGESGLLERLITNEIGKDDWLMLMKAGKYDAMQADAEARVAEARTEGEIAGRNANIDLQKRKRTKVEGMPGNLPASGGGNPSKPQDDGMLAFLNRRRKSVWDN